MSQKSSPLQSAESVSQVLTLDSPKSDIGTPDPEFLKPPGCVICDYHADEANTITFLGAAAKDNDIITNIGGISGDALKKSPTTTSTEGTPELKRI